MLFVNNSTTTALFFQVERRIMASLSSKLYGFEKVLSPLVTKACIAVCPKNKANFNVDNVRVVKIPGGGVHDSLLVHGVVIRREPEGSIRSAKKAKVAVYAQGVDTSSTETKVTCIIGLACLFKTGAEVGEFWQGTPVTCQATKIKKGQGCKVVGFTFDPLHSRKMH